MFKFPEIIQYTFLVLTCAYHKFLIYYTVQQNLAYPICTPLYCTCLSVQVNVNTYFTNCTT